MSKLKQKTKYILYGVGFAIAILFLILAVVFSEGVADKVTLSVIFGVLAFLTFGLTAALPGWIHKFRTRHKNS